MPKLNVALDRALDRLESAASLDGVADRVSGVLSKFFPAGVVKDALSGTWLGHPLHPLLVALPIGAWTSASVLDVADRRFAPAAQRLVAIGLLSSLPAVAAGGSDFVDTTGAERRVGLVHWAGAWTSIGLYAASWQRRRSGGSGRLLALAGAGVLGATGYLGGHLAYALGVGVDTTAFESGPTEWTRVASEAEVVEGAMTQVRAEGVALVLIRQHGRVYALADRCTHRGGPLSDGTLETGDPGAACVVCPWHGSAFSVTDGSVARGPATRPQPAYEVKAEGGELLIRRSEQRSLRENPI